MRRLIVEVQTAAERNRLLLSADELAELTGFKRPYAQVRELKRHGWRLEVSASGLAVDQRRKTYEGTALGSPMIGRNEACDTATLSAIGRCSSGASISFVTQGAGTTR